MKQSWKPLILCILLILISIAHSSEDKSIYKIGQSSLGSANQLTNYRHIKLIKLSQIDSRYIFFITSPAKNSNYKSLRMAIFKKQQKKVPLIVCEYTGTDTCYLNANLVKKEEELVVSMQCDQQCSFTFSSYWSNIQILKPNVEQKFLFSEKGKAQLFHINLQAVSYKQLRIVLSPQTRIASYDDIKIYGVFGFDKNPFEAVHDFQSISLWNGAHGVFLSEQEIKDSKISLLVVGSSNIVYNLKAEIIDSYEENLQLEHKQYEYLTSNQSKTYTLGFYHVRQQTSEYVLGISKVSGDVTIEFFKDKQSKQPFKPLNFEYMNDQKYIFIRTVLQEAKITEVYCKVTANNKNSVLLLLFNERSFNNGIQLNENIYDFIAVNTPIFAFLHFNDLVFTNNEQMEAQINFNILPIIGNFTTIKFKKCINRNYFQCYDLKNFESKQYALDMDAKDTGFIGIKSTFKLIIKNTDLIQINDYEKKGIIMIQFTNGAKQTSLASISYTFGNAIQHLRENHPLEETISISQKKYYRFLANDELVKGVRIHIAKIDGSITASYARQDPTHNKNGQVAVKQFIGDFEYISENITSIPIFIVVEADEFSTYSIVAQIIYKNNQLTTISLIEDVQYKFRLAPKGQELLRVHTVYNSLKFEYKATSSISICLLNKNKVCTDQIPEIGKQGSIQVQQFRDNSGTILIENPSDKAFIQVIVLYHSLTNVKHCEKRKVGQLFSESFNTNSCLEFLLPQKIQNLVFFAQRTNLGEFNTQIKICDHLYQEQYYPKITILKQKIEKICKQSNKADRYFEVILTGNSIETNEMKVQYSLHRSSDIITLPDGVAYKVQSTYEQGFEEGQLKRFYHKLVNLIDTDVILRSTRGNFGFYASVIDQSDKYKVTVNKQNYQYTSEISNYFRYPILKISKQQFYQKKCIICGLLISVYSLQSFAGVNQFSLEVVQNNIQIKDHAVYSNHLLANSIDYYEYRVNSEKCNLIIQMSYPMNKCAEIYLSNTENPSQQNFIIKESGDKLVFSNCKDKNYFIAVQAVQDCPYSISLSNSPFSISKIQRGTPINVNLQKDQLKYIIFRHVINQSFKISSMFKYGHLEIYVNKLTDEYQNLLKDGKALTHEMFKFYGKDSIQIQTSQDGFCHNCYYLAQVSAKQKTQGQIILADMQSSVVLPNGKIFSDVLTSQGDSTKFSLHNVLAGDLQFVVHKGQINVTINFQEQSSYHVFSKKKVVQHFDFKITHNAKSAYDWAPISVNATCLATDCVYSVVLKDQTIKIIQQIPMPLEEGNPSFLFLNNKDINCVSGFFKADSEIILSLSRNQKQAFKTLSLFLKINQTEIPQQKYEINIVSNTMSISLKQQPEKPLPFKLCIQSNYEQIIIPLIQQAQGISLLSEDAEIIVKGQKDYIIYPEGDFLLDMFECSTFKSMLKYSERFSDLDKDNIVKMNQLETIAMPDQPHAVRINGGLPKFLRVKSNLSILRWLPINENAQQGIGYNKYSTGSFKYTTSQNNIVFSWQKIHANTETKTEIQTIAYQIYISNNEDHILSASQCQKFYDDMQIMVLNAPQYDANLKQNIITISKQEIKNKFGNNANLFVSLVGDLILQTPKGQQYQSKMEFYRFTYHQQQLPVEVFADPPKYKAIIIIGGFSLILIAVLVILYMLLKKLIPIVSRLRSNNMIEQDQVQKQQDVKQNVESHERIIIPE